jgi:hypothetical protein
MSFGRGAPASGARPDGYGFPLPPLTLAEEAARAVRRFAAGSHMRRYLRAVRRRSAATRSLRAASRSPCGRRVRRRAVSAPFPV